MLCRYQSLLCQLLQHLGHQCRRNPVLLGNLVRAASVLLAVVREMLHRDQAVIRLFREFEHAPAASYANTLDAITTETVAFQIYPSYLPFVNAELPPIFHQALAIIALTIKIGLVLDRSFSAK